MPSRGPAPICKSVSKIVIAAGSPNLLNVFTKRQWTHCDYDHWWGNAIKSILLIPKPSGNNNKTFLRGKKYFIIQMEKCKWPPSLPKLNWSTFLTNKNKGNEDDDDVTIERTKSKKLIRLKEADSWPHPSSRTIAWLQFPRSFSNLPSCISCGEHLVCRQLEMLDNQLQTWHRNVSAFCLRPSIPKNRQGRIWINMYEWPLVNRIHYYSNSLMPLPFVKQQDTFAQQIFLQKYVKLMENSRHLVSW